MPSLTLRSLHPVKPAPGTTPASPKVGVLGPVVGQAGTAMATEAIKLLVGFGEPLIGARPHDGRGNAARRCADLRAVGLSPVAAPRADVAAIVVGGGGESAWVASLSLT